MRLLVLLLAVSHATMMDAILELSSQVISIFLFLYFLPSCFPFSFSSSADRSHVILMMTLFEESVLPSPRAFQTETVKGRLLRSYDIGLSRV
jgi:hypothetical protein